MNRVCEILGITKPVVQAPINTVSSAASLIKSIDTCAEIVEELARGYEA